MGMARTILLCGIRDPQPGRRAHDLKIHRSVFRGAVGRITLVATSFGVLPSLHIAATYP